MQRTPAGSSSSSTGGGSGSGGGGGGGSEVSRGGLARFRSAPATWLETLLEEEDEEELLKPNQCLTQLLATNSPTPTPTSTRNSFADQSLFEPGGLNRLNSSPADFLGNSDGYFSNYGIPPNYEYLSHNMDVSPSSNSKRARQVDTQFPSPTHLKGEQSGLVDMEMDKLLEDSVPCRVRAKRGCATHPRSIAERVRRTRISDRIRKLQELVPNMDKQTNTADMLDEAVEYVKFLQRQIQELSEHQKKCTCTAKE